MSELDQIRRELEARQRGEPEISICPFHGEHSSIICTECYAIQEQRVERESVPLRYANTTEAKRKQVLAALAERNGH